MTIEINIPAKTFVQVLAKKVVFYFIEHYTL